MNPAAPNSPISPDVNQEASPEQELLKIIDKHGKDSKQALEFVSAFADACDAAMIRLESLDKKAGGRDKDKIRVQSLVKKDMMKAFILDIGDAMDSLESAIDLVCQSIRDEGERSALYEEIIACMDRLEYRERGGYLQ